VAVAVYGVAVAVYAAGSDPEVAVVMGVAYVWIGAAGAACAYDVKGVMYVWTGIGACGADTYTGGAVRIGVAVVAGAGGVTSTFVSAAAVFAGLVDAARFFFFEASFLSKTRK